MLPLVRALLNPARMDVLQQIENTAFGIWVRESGSLWSYPTIIFLHSLGLSFVVGLSVALDLRLLGVAPNVPIRPLDKLFPVMWAGFWINAASGVALLVADATTMLDNWVFYSKMACMAAAMVVLVKTRRRLFRAPGALGPDDRVVPSGMKLLAGASLLLWAGAITAGRLTAYIGPGAAIKGGR